MTKSMKIRNTTNNKGYRVRKDPELPDVYKDEYKPGDRIDVYFKRSKQFGFRNRLYVPVKTPYGDGWILNEAIYETEG